MLRMLVTGLVVSVGFGVSLVRCGEAAGEFPSSARPNILFILADDLGRHQLGCYGSAYYETPRIDQLSSEGMRFLDAYSAGPVCSPTRASLMTGLSPARLHLTDYIPGLDPKNKTLVTPPWRKFLPLEQVTVAERLREGGYRTGIFGKWHLNRDKKYRPGRPGDPASQGFESVLTTEKPGAGPPSRFSDDWHHTREITEASLEFLTEHRQQSFFCFVSFNAIHAPEIETPELVARFQAKPGSGGRNDPQQAAMLRRMDDAIARILDRLDELKLAEKTLVVFFSDNGQKGPKTGDGFRGSKGDLYEGGIRMPLVVRWPGVIDAGSRCRVPVISDDLMPTFLELAGISNSKQGLDGKSLVSLLKRPEAKLERDSLCWHYPHYHGLGLGPQSAIRVGRMKLIEWHERSLLGEPHPFELYDLEADPAERHDLADGQPEKVAALAEQLQKWKRETGAQMPTVAVARLSAEATAATPGVTLVLNEGFSRGADRWQPADPEAWKVIDVEGGKVFSQFGKSSFKPPHRSPFNIAILKDVRVNDFSLEVKVKSTAPERNHRDVCLFFGYQDPAHFYYVHFASKADPRAHKIFKVDAADRLNIAEKSTDGVKWTDGWHRLKVVRQTGDGLIETYFDDMQTPVMVAHDTAFATGQIGIGTFDDTADFAEVKLWGEAVAAKE